MLTPETRKLLFRMLYTNQVSSKYKIDLQNIIIMNVNLHNIANAFLFHL